MRVAKELIMLPENQLPNNQATGVREENLLLKIWLQPQATLRFILRVCPTKHVTLLMLLGGIARMLGRVNPEQPLPPSALVPALIIGSLSGWIFFYIYAWGLLIAGKLLHGPADFAVFETVVAWSLVPTAASIPLSLLLLDADTGARVAALHLSLSLVTMLFGLGQLGLAAWSLTILFKGIKLVQGFNNGKVLLNIVLPGGIVLLLIGSFLFLQKMLEAASQ